MLELRGLSTGYGGTPVVHDIDLMVGAGEIVTPQTFLIGVGTK